MRDRDAVVELLDHHDGTAGDGVVWALPESEDLNANLVHLDPGHEIGRHVNREVDVVIVVLAGGDDLHVDDRVHPLAPHAVARLPKGTARHIRAGDDGLRYLTIHRRRVKNALTGMPIGGGKGGADFDPKGRSDGAVFFVEEMLRARGGSLDGKTYVVSGSGNVAIYAIEMLALGLV